MPRPAVGFRLDDVLDAALALLNEKGLTGVTTNALAARAKCSKDTLYALFKDRDAILAALVSRQAERLNKTLAVAEPAQGTTARERLTEAAANLYRLLLSEGSLAINRAAIADTTGQLSAILIDGGRSKSAPRLKALIRDTADHENRALADIDAAYLRFYGLLLGDRQILALHRAYPANPADNECEAAAVRAVGGLFADTTAS